LRHVLVEERERGAGEGQGQTFEITRVPHVRQVRYQWNM
jgi:hypothetical protein